MTLADSSLEILNRIFQLCKQENSENMSRGLTTGRITGMRGRYEIIFTQVPKTGRSVSQPIICEKGSSSQGKSHSGRHPQEG